VKLFGFQIPLTKAQTFSAVDSRGGGWFRFISEPWGGAWQANVTVDGQKDVLAFSAVFACVTIIASDIAKLGICLKHEDDNGISSEVEGQSPFLQVLYKPNHFQTWFKFIEQWIVSKLLYGNAYVLKQRDARGIVTALYVLDAQRVTALVTDDGGIYYQLSRDDLSKQKEPITIPSSEIIHDTMVSLWHPLVGVSPIYACGMSATMGNRIQKNSATFFQNMSRPSGQLTSPTTVSDETAARLKSEFEQNFGGGRIGRLFVAGDGLKYEPMMIPARDAQLIDQLKWSVEDVARCFHVPMYKLGGPEPVRTSIESLNQTYYSDCLQALIESAEALLDEGLELNKNGNDYHVEFELEGLMRMDTAARYTAKGQAVKDGWMAPNEARAGEDLPPVSGGESPYLQQQNFSLLALSKRDALADPFASGKPAPAANDPAPERQVAAKMSDVELDFEVRRELELELA
jgi:HK97 family phage portal protein